MDRTTQSFSVALDALVRPDLDVADVLARLISDCAAATGSDACALMARDDNGELSLLSAESHRAVEMELWQIQREAGPCVDVMKNSRPLRVSGADALRERWGPVGEAITGAGYAAVDAFPMRWRGTVLGGLNMFHSDAAHQVPESLAQAYADMATLVVVQSAPAGVNHVRARMHEALTARGIVEQAKGVLAYQHDVDLDRAYVLLLGRAQEEGTSLTRVALDVVAHAASRGRTSD